MKQCLFSCYLTSTATKPYISIHFKPMKVQVSGFTINLFICTEDNYLNTVFTKSSILPKNWPHICISHH